MNNKDHVWPPLVACRDTGIKAGFFAGCEDFFRNNGIGIIRPQFFCRENKLMPGENLERLGDIAILESFLQSGRPSLVFFVEKAEIDWIRLEKILLDIPKHDWELIYLNGGHVLPPEPGSDDYVKVGRIIHSDVFVINRSYSEHCLEILKDTAGGSLNILANGIDCYEAYGKTYASFPCAARSKSKHQYCPDGFQQAERDVIAFALAERIRGVSP
jgi:hypothetical protein